MRSENDGFHADEPTDSADLSRSAEPVRQSSPHDERSDDHPRRASLRHTRTSAAWLSVVVAVLFGVALVDFIAQNTRDVHIEFFSASGRVPVAVALLCATLAGAVVVVSVGVGRVAQLRLGLRRERRRLRSRSHRDNAENGIDTSPSHDDDAETP